MLFFANHQTDYIGGVKAQKKYNAEDCATTKVTSNGGLKAEQKFSAEDYIVTMVMGNDGLKAQQEYSTGQRPGEERDSYFAL